MQSDDGIEQDNCMNNMSTGHMEWTRGMMGTDVNHQKQMTSSLPVIAAMHMLIMEKFVVLIFMYYLW